VNTNRRTYCFEGHFINKWPLATCSASLRDTVGKNDPTPVPCNAQGHLYFPATGIRGKLRRASAAYIRDKLIASTGNPRPFTLDMHFMMVLGGIKGAGEQEKASVALQQQWKAKNPHLSIFGAGDAGVLGFVDGALSVGNATCTTDIKPEVFSGARTDDLFRSPEGIDYLSQTDADLLIQRAEAHRNYSKTKSRAAALEKQIKSDKKAGKPTDALSAELDDLQDLLENKSVSVGMPLAGYQAIPADQVLAHEFDLYNATPVEFALLLQALNRFSMNAMLGSHHATGCGKVAGEWSVTAIDCTTGEQESLGTLILTPRRPVSFPGMAEYTALLDNGFAAKAFDFSIPY
jgi:CRISPR type IV-associated protein Csf2